MACLCVLFIFRWIRHLDTYPHPTPIPESICNLDVMASDSPVSYFTKDMLYLIPVLCSQVLHLLQECHQWWHHQVLLQCLLKLIFSQDLQKWVPPPPAVPGSTMIPPTGSGATSMVTSVTCVVARLNIILISLSPSLTSWKKLECIVEVPVFEELNLGERTYSLGHHLLSYSTRKFWISSTISLSLPYCIDFQA